MELDRRRFAGLVLAAAATASAAPRALAGADPLPSWREGPAKSAILDFVRDTTESGGPKFVPPEERIACFDQDGTLWVEHPIYTQLVYCFERVPDVVRAKPELAGAEPFRTVLSGDRAAIAALPMRDLLTIVAATLSGMDVEAFREDVAKWIAGARDPRWKRPYTELIYLPQLELMRFLRANGYKTYIVTGGGQDFVRAYAEPVYGVPREQVIGSIGQVSFQIDASGKPVLMKEPALLLNDDKAGKPEGIHLVIGRRPRFVFGNSLGDREMCEYGGGGDGARLIMLLLHDDGDREYAYGPARNLPDSPIGTFPQALDDEAREKGWRVVSMKSDWRRVFAWAD